MSGMAYLRAGRAQDTRVLDAFDRLRDRRLNSVQPLHLGGELFEIYGGRGNVELLCDPVVQPLHAVPSAFDPLQRTERCR